MPLNDRLRDLRKALNYTQEKMGDICGIKKSAYSMIENGHTHLSKRNLQTLLDTLDVNEAWLVSGEGDMFHSKRAIYEDADKIKAARKDMKMVPVFSMDIVGHEITNGRESVNYIQKYLPFVGAGVDDVATVVSGNSMAPMLPAGSVVLLRQVACWQSFIEFGQTYLIVLNDGRRFVREVRRHEDPDKFMLHSKSESYESSELPIRMIVDMFLIRAVYYEMTV
ncbi:MAG: helix-turn-helix domain-containing protein [Rikenellaceae bacterium]|nr:helix-turn-helix domain-containing protein [Rikenellaceae bacterium]